MKTLNILHKIMNSYILDYTIRIYLKITFPVDRSWQKLLLYVELNLGDYN